MALPEPGQSQFAGIGGRNALSVASHLKPLSRDTEKRRGDPGECGDPGEYRIGAWMPSYLAGDATVFDHSGWLAALEEES